VFESRQVPISSLLQNVLTSSAAHSASYSIENEVFPGVKWLQSKLKFSPLSTAKVKHKWSYASAPPIRLRGMDKNITSEFYFAFRFSYKFLL
jgi:hypothetical protein